MEDGFVALPPFAKTRKCCEFVFNAEPIRKESHISSAWQQDVFDSYPANCRNNWIFSNFTSETCPFRRYFFANCQLPAVNRTKEIAVSRPWQVMVPLFWRRKNPRRPFLRPRLGRTRHLHLIFPVAGHLFRIYESELWQENGICSTHHLSVPVTWFSNTNTILQESVKKEQQTADLIQKRCKQQF